MALDVIVIGGGVMGLSAAVELRRRGHNVTLLEQFEPGHLYGSSHGQTRVIRTAYFEHPDYVPLAQRAWKAWLGLDPSLLLRTGGLYFGQAQSPLISGSIDAAWQHGLPHELLSPEEVTRRFPALRPPKSATCFWESECGVLMAKQAVQTLLNKAMQQGVKVLTNCPVANWAASNASVRVRTPDANLEAERLVICGGPWSAGLLSDLGLHLRVTGQLVAYTIPSAPSDFEAENLPVTCFETGRDRFFYTIPSVPTSEGERTHFKFACHDPGDLFDPDNRDRTSHPREAEALLPELLQALPEAGPILHTETCLYTNSPDGHFILDLHPDHPNVSFACGFSGHGFKFAPVIGEAMADLAETGASPLPIGFLNLSRFPHA